MSEVNIQLLGVADSAVGHGLAQSLRLDRGCC
jgi:hypothetical protein